tara:strand:- start:1454 stop:1684 length:231 start_codon:yes stop_codon:yes gene_type:complete
MSHKDVNKNIVISQETFEIVFQLLNNIHKRLDYNSLSYGELRERIRELKDEADDALTELKSEVIHLQNAYKPDDGR